MSGRAANVPLFDGGGTLRACASGAPPSQSSAMRVLLTGMSGTGKSTLVRELVRRGYVAYNADDDGFSEPRTDRRWGRRTDAVASLLTQAPKRGLPFFAGCSEEQGELPFELRKLLSTSEDEIVRRRQTRTSNQYGRTPDGRRQVLADRALIKPLLRQSADLVLDAATTTGDLADQPLTRGAWIATAPDCRSVPTDAA